MNLSEQRIKEILTAAMPKCVVRGQRTHRSLREDSHGIHDLGHRFGSLRATETSLAQALSRMPLDSVLAAVANEAGTITAHTGVALSDAMTSRSSSAAAPGSGQGREDSSYGPLMRS